MTGRAAAIALSVVLLIGAFGAISADAKKKKAASVDVTATYAATGGTSDTISGTVSSKKSDCEKATVQIHVLIGGSDVPVASASTDGSGSYTAQVPAGAPSGTQGYALTPKKKGCKEGKSPPVVVP